MVGGWHSRIESLQVRSTLDFKRWTLDLDLDCDNFVEAISYCQTDDIQRITLELEPVHARSKNFLLQDLVRLPSKQTKIVFNRQLFSFCLIKFSYKLRCLIMVPCKKIAVAWTRIFHGCWCNFLKWLKFMLISQSENNMKRRFQPIKFQLKSSACRS